jgi:hypothetical protein
MDAIAFEIGIDLFRGADFSITRQPRNYQANLSSKKVARLRARRPQVSVTVLT